MPPPLGFIRKQDRSQEQHDAHARAEGQMVRFTLPPLDVAAGTKLTLSDCWNRPEVVADTGLTWDRSPFHQLTGSCVGCGGGNALYTLMAVQRCLADLPTKAFVPYWPFNYGRCRFNEGDRGQGEGAMGSSFAEVIVKEGVIDAATEGLTKFQNTDGLTLTSNQEYQWSDGGSSLVTKWMDAAKVHPVGAAAPIRSVADGKAAILNGYPWTFACNNYIGNASVTGSGADAAVVGYWDGSGGHQQWVFGYWENPTLGPLYAVGNNWPKGTYPKDPAGLPLVCCWVKEAKVESAIRNLDAEVYALSHLAWFPAQPSVLDLLI